MSLKDFLKTETSKADLATALAVIREFKAGESVEEWFSTQFAAWARLEQLENYLAHLVDSKPLEEGRWD